MKSHVRAAEEAQGSIPEHAQGSSPWEAPLERPTSNTRTQMMASGPPASPSSADSIAAGQQVVAVFVARSPDPDDRRSPGAGGVLVADLWLAVNVISGHIERQLLAPIGLTWIAYRLLNLIHGTRMDIYEASVQLGVTLSEVGDVVSRLAAKGLVDLSFSESGSQIMVQTIDNRDDVASVLERVAREENRLLGPLPECEFTRVLGALKTAATRVQRQPPPTPGHQLATEDWAI
jgi:DNA-binding MarR family transcriptional regulator